MQRSCAPSAQRTGSSRRATSRPGSWLGAVGTCIPSTTLSRGTATPSPPFTTISSSGTTTKSSASAIRASSGSTRISRSTSLWRGSLRSSASACSPSSLQTTAERQCICGSCLRRQQLAWDRSSDRCSTGRTGSSALSTSLPSPTLQTQTGAQC
eukprot:Amastigsp_a179396_6.p3 type:complete len:154 gc:universal Amastigsp_a179396_6:530-69(-)